MSQLADALLVLALACLLFAPACWMADWLDSKLDEDWRPR